MRFARLFREPGGRVDLVAMRPHLSHAAMSARLVGRAGYDRFVGGGLGIRQGLSAVLLLVLPDLGARLFDRLPDGYQITAQGEELRTQLRGVSEQIETAQMSLSGRNLGLSGAIRITTLIR